MLCLLVGLLDKGIPVAKGASQHARENKIKLVGERPRLGKICNLKTDIGRDTRDWDQWLGGTVLVALGISHKGG